MTSPIVSVEIGRSTWQGPAEEAPRRAATARHPHWAVTVETGGEQIVRLETECYGGRELSAADEDAVRTAAQHLLAFIGDRSADMAECAAFSAGYEAGERDGRASGQQVRALEVDDLAQIIRVVDGNNTLGAGELAEAILEAMPVPRIVGALTPAPQPEGHPDDLAVDRFAVAMKDKLARKRAEGRGGWDRKDECSAEYLTYLLVRHIWKGDPLDVGNLAMMLHQRGERIVLDCEAQSIAPTPTPATPTAQEAVPVGWRPISEAAPGTRALVKYPSGQIDYCYLTDWDCPIKNAWRYAGTAEHGRHAGWPDSFVTIADLEAALTAHPPQPSEAVAEAQIDAIAVALSKRIYNQTEGEWQPSVRQADELARAALRALKGGSNG
ncbi:hypothetical protein [Paracoccus denitrificans]|uniref:hypothetical protein n=1 Tax=Paracoccus denitrificans TaxID=266 RepID=UPI0033651905